MLPLAINWKSNQWRGSFGRAYIIISPTCPGTYWLGLLPLSCVGLDQRKREQTQFVDRPEISPRTQHDRVHGNSSGITCSRNHQHSWWRRLKYSKMKKHTKSSEENLPRSTVLRLRRNCKELLSFSTAKHIQIYTPVKNHGAGKTKSVLCKRKGSSGGLSYTSMKLVACVPCMLSAMTIETWRVKLQ